MKKNRKYWKAQYRAAQEQSVKSIELATTAIETMKAMQAAVLQPVQPDPWAVSYFQ